MNIVLTCRKTGKLFILGLYCYEKNYYHLESEENYGKFTLRKGVNLGKHLRERYDYVGIL